MTREYVGNYNYDDIFGNGKDRYKPSYLRDVTRVHFYNNDDENRKTFISERKDPLPDADSFNGKEGKRKLLIEK